MMLNNLWGIAAVVAVGITVCLAGATAAGKVSGWWILLGVAAVCGCYVMAWEDE